jgi:large subunit ribosomal protein L33
MREIITLACAERKHTDRVEYKKYCRFCGKHTPHKETR